MKHLMKFENFNNIEITQSGGLKCDNTSCDWTDPSISINDYKDWVNKPCPKCGECVLTEEDFNKTNMFVNAINMINQMSPSDLEELAKNMDSDDIIDAYLKLKNSGFQHKGGDEWSIKPSDIPTKKD